MEQTKLVKFQINDNVIAVELKFKLDEERLYIHDEAEGWVRINASAMIARDVLKPRDVVIH